MSTNKQALLDSAESTIGILENIAGFEPSDIDGDAVELRFETEGGFDTGCDVSIVDQCQKAADVIRALLDELEAMKRANAVQADHINQQQDRIESLEKKNGELGRAYGAAEKRNAELEAREVSVPNVSSERFWVEFNGRLVFREETYRSAVFKALDAAGITVKGDSE